MKRVLLMKWEFKADEVESLLIETARKQINEKKVIEWRVKTPEDGSMLVYAVLVEEIIE